MAFSDFEVTATMSAHNPVSEAARDLAAAETVLRAGKMAAGPSKVVVGLLVVRTRRGRRVEGAYQKAWPAPGISLLALNIGHCRCFHRGRVPTL